MESNLPAFLARLRARDPDTLRGVVNDHGRRLYRAARGMGFQQSDAEDLVQGTLTVFLQTLDRFEGRSDVGTWLFGILQHKARERRRRNQREEVTDTVDDMLSSDFDERGQWIRPPVAADRQVAAGQMAVALGACLEGLPEQQRAVFHLREVEGLSAAEVGRILECSAGNVGVLFHRARLRLRACLESKGWGRSL